MQVRRYTVADRVQGLQSLRYVTDGYCIYATEILQSISAVGELNGVC